MLLTATMVPLLMSTGATLAWNIADITMGMMALCNMTGIILLGKYAIRLLHDYKAQLKQGIASPTFNKEILPDIKDKLECW